MRRLSFGVLLIALSTLMLELTLTRVFDVVLVPNLGYFVVTSAVFAFGLAGVYATLRPIPVENDITHILVTRSVGFALATLLLIPLIIYLPLNYAQLGRHPLKTLFGFLALYTALVLPFFLAGTVLIAVFSKYALSIQRLYFWDLIGAGLGSIVAIPLMSSLSPSGLMLLASASGFLAATLFAGRSRARTGLLACTAIIAATPLVMLPHYIEFPPQVDKRGIKGSLDTSRNEFQRWDPISKINVIDETWSPAISVPWHLSGDRKAIQYDGGNQTSYFYKFDGNLAGLRALVDQDKSHINEHFWQLGVLASHYLKRDSGQNVLIIGSAGGQETKAALMYGAAHVDAVELVPTVVNLGTGRYSNYIGNIFHDPRVHVEAGEGRSFLRHSHKLYDIIQMYSNHTNSSIEQGTGAINPVYLQTAEAYEDYFSHLSANGILHINHYAFPRMITTAALAWKRMGRTDFASHVVVYTMPSQPTLPTLLIKMQPWTAAELDQLNSFLIQANADPKDRMKMVENPLDPTTSFLSSDFYSGDFPDEVAAKTLVAVTPRTDDKPYFAMNRKSFDTLTADQAHFLDEGSAFIINAKSSDTDGIPMDVIHLILTGIASIFYIVVFVLVPLRLSSIGKQKDIGAGSLIAYFSCLGAGFITVEIVFIQKFTHLIGSPLYTYSTVLFTMLIGAGIGSAASERFGITAQRRWKIPFVMILLLGAALLLAYPALSHWALEWTTLGRIMASAAMMFPVAFFLGMPFPLGILAIADKPRAVVAWAWGMNGLFTVVGGFLSMLVSMAFGFNVAISFALGLYAIAFGVFKGLKGAQDVVTAPVLPSGAPATSV
jgi:spermidine synthase